MTALFPLAMLLILIGLSLLLHAELIKPRPRWMGATLSAQVAGQFTAEEREELFAFLADHGLNKDDIGEIAYHQVGAKRWISAVEFLKDSEGRRYVDPLTQAIAQRSRYKALRAPLPTWWVPSA